MKIVLIILGIIYALSPYDFLPDLIPVWGWLDDFAVLLLIWRYVLSPASGKPDPGGMFGRKGPRSGPDPFSGNRYDPRDASGKGGASGGRDPHAVLGLSRDASKEEIRRVYRDLAIKYHPDKASHLGRADRETAEARFKELQQAYQELLKGDRNKNRP